MNNLPNIVRERLKTAPAGLHPDPNLLSAFAEQALSDGERTQVLDHLARCGECRDVVALATPPTTIVGGRDTAYVSKAPWFSWPILRWGALAACVVIVGTAVLMQRNLKTAPMSASAPQQAKLEGDTLREIAPLNDNDVVGRIDGKEESKSDKPSVAKRSATRGDVDELKQSLALSSTRAKSEKLLSETGSLPDVAKKRVGFSSGAITAGNPVPAPSRQPAELRNLPAAEGNAVDLVASSAPKASPETIEVEAMAAPVQTGQSASQKDEALGKAKPSAPSQSGFIFATPPAAPPAEKTLANTEARSNLRAELYRQHADVGRWTISSDGQLQHSIDSGKTWQPVTVAEKATFRALSANGPDLWVGGPAGLLYHSTDAGGHWTEVKPTANGATLMADIAALEFTDRQHGKLTTSAGEVWITVDAGQTWRKQP